MFLSPAGGLVKSVVLSRDTETEKTLTPFCFTVVDLESLFACSPQRREKPLKFVIIDFM